MTTLYTLLIGFGIPLAVVCAVLAGAYWLATRAIDRTERHSDYDQED